MGIIDLIFPRVCVGCKREGKYICEGCQKKLARPEQICPMCCRPSIDGWAHPRCKPGAGMQRLLVGLPYRGLVQQCLKKVKYKSSWEIIDLLFGLGNFEKCEGIVVPVPMYEQKKRERGFNQAGRLAELLAKSCKVRNLVMLERVRATKPMFGLKKKERKENVENAFRLRETCRVNTCTRIILVDDVWTTGATMRECARILKETGAREIWGVVLAR